MPIQTIDGKFQCNHTILTLKIPGLFPPISTSKMLKFSKKSQKIKIKIKNTEISTP
jgi:hypothetical protein